MNYLSLKTMPNSLQNPNSVVLPLIMDGRPGYKVKRLYHKGGLRGEKSCKVLLIMETGSLVWAGAVEKSEKKVAAMVVVTFS